MNEHDRLERELQSLRPQPPSTKLKAKIAGELASSPHVAAARPNTGGHRLWYPTIALSIALAALIAVSLRWKPRPIPAPALPQPATLDFHVALDPALPSWWNFHQAAAQSPEQFDALLDRDSPAGARGGNQQSTAPRLSVLTSINDSDLGEL
jgi:hypothetical protein